MNNANKIVVLSLFLCITLLSLTFVGLVQAQTSIYGVESGMVFDYALTCQWSSSDLDYSEIPKEFLLINYTTHVEVIVSTVNSTHVTVANPWYFKDGTSSMERGAVNLLTGDGYGFVGVITANLNKGDLVHPSGNDELKILDTTTRNYGGSINRETNHIRIENEDKVSGIKGTRELYFDKKTGILVEQTDKTETTKVPFITSISTWKLISVSGVDGWSVSDAPSTLYVVLIVIVIIAVVAISIIVYKKKISKHKTTG